MIDTHAHLELLSYPAGWMDGLSAVVLAGTNFEDSLANIEIAQQNPKLKAVVGYHPENLENDLRDLKELIAKNHQHIVAIGECGLDILYPKRQEQEKYFETQVELALEYDLPLIIHCRKLNDEIVEILKKYPKHRGVFHCYTGGKKRINKILDLGEWYFGLDGNLTYEEGLIEVVKTIPQDRLLLETDSPFLTPLPFRGEINKPAYIKYIYEKVSEIWGRSFKDTETAIDKNACRLFQIVR